MGATENASRIGQGLADLPARVAMLWQSILRSNQAEVFAGYEVSAKNRPHGHDRLPQPGFVGPSYRPGGVMIIGQNPGNDVVANGESSTNLRQYELLRQLRDAVDSAAVVSASHELMAALGSEIMPTWSIVKNIVLPLLSALRLTLDDVAYTNLVKFRTVESNLASQIYGRSWDTTSAQIRLLEPAYIIALGLGTHREITRRYIGSAEIHRVQRSRGDWALPDKGRRDIELISTRLRNKLHPALKPAIPNIFVQNFPAALAYYTNALGFRPLFVYGEPPFYAHVARDEAILALRLVRKPVIDHTAGEDLLSAFIEVSDVNTLHQSLQFAGAHIRQPPRDEPWGMRSLIVNDPDGNLILFASNLPVNGT